MSRGQVLRTCTRHSPQRGTGPRGPAPAAVQGALTVPHEILGPRFERRDDRGVFREVLTGFPAGTVVCGPMHAGAVMGNHYHRRTRVFFYLFTGRADVRTVEVETGAKDEFPVLE